MNYFEETISFRDKKTYKAYCVRCNDYTKTSHNDYTWGCDNCNFSWVKFKLIYYICG